MITIPALDVGSKPFCVNCKWVGQHYPYKCENPQLGDIDLVTGHAIYDPCDKQRQWGGKCKPEGVYFEAKVKVR